ncbi:hypothetical protein [Epilithonimonas hispanica]|uniref:Uncharacterized protein n=1 Tax=Epilithonimonas hispanica TaxID=358687 RepID=A0A3D9CTU2_9FLAO|nr:hypothetical protein [Epilithonimonas hispanica]REC69190.1 hypothetical protein DRF58_12645 [Epilithonimonas hispanica]
MPRQKGLFKIEGSIDGVTFYRNADGHFVRMAGGVSKSRIMNDPAFARTRENITEFGNNAKAAKVLRDALGPLVKNAKDSRTSNRLMQLFNKVKNLDVVSLRGQRKISIGLEDPLSQNVFQKFDFNKKAQLSNVLKRTYELDALAGTLDIPGFIPAVDLLKPEGATHAQITYAALGLDFDTADSSLVQATPLNFALDNVVQDIALSLTPPVGLPSVFQVLLIEFFQEVNTLQYPLNNGAFNVLFILNLS